MPRLAGFSTGALALADFSGALTAMQGIAEVTCVELSALRYEELLPVLEAVPEIQTNSEFAKKYGYVSMHAPSNFDARQEEEIILLLRTHVPKDWPIVLHPDTIHDFSAWQEFGEQLAIENMDRRKTTGRSAAELDSIFEKLPKARLCLDIGHARQVDTTMTEAYKILKSHSARLCQLHVSEVNSASRHDPLSDSAIRAFQEVARMIPEQIPAIIESNLTPLPAGKACTQVIQDEIARVQDALTPTEKRAISARQHLTARHTQLGC